MIITIRYRKNSRTFFNYYFESNIFSKIVIKNTKIIRNMHNSKSQDIDCIFYNKYNKISE